VAAEVRERLALIALRPVKNGDDGELR
jgi:hypothetical protein